MICELCGKPANWDTSFGLKNFTVCQHCMEELSKRTALQKSDLLTVIIVMGDIEQREIGE
jgi:ribosome-binding protein aMBF1 (putative translation factor)